MISRLLIGGEGTVGRQASTAAIPSVVACALSDRGPTCAREAHRKIIVTVVARRSAKACAFAFAQRHQEALTVLFAPVQLSATL